jgi:outer membrane protein assembly factor BamD
MNRRFVFLILVAAGVVLFPFNSPAPLIYTPGEGWTYEPVGGGAGWQRTNAKDQLIVAQDAFDKKDYSLALKGARRVVKAWPLSDYTPQAQYLVGRCYENKKRDEKAFNEYQKLLENFPKAMNYDEVLRRQYEIANRFLAGEWFRLWGYIPFFPSMEKTAGMFAKIVKNGPYSEVAPQAQMNIGEAREKQANYPEAVKAYERAADRYNDRPKIASAALFQEGLAYEKQARTAEYDQSTAAEAIATLTDFMALYPDDPRVAEAQNVIGALRNEQARGNFAIAKFYEKNGKWKAARTYYNEVQRNPNSPYAAEALRQIDLLNKRIQEGTR